MITNPHSKELTRPLFEAELDEIAKVMRVCTVEMADRLVQENITSKKTVMLHRDDRYGGKPGHYRRYVETGPFGNAVYYIRMGKRGTVKRYLGACEITFLDGRAALFQYRLRTED